MQLTKDQDDKLKGVGNFLEKQMEKLNKVPKPAFPHFDPEQHEVLYEDDVISFVTHDFVAIECVMGLQQICDTNYPQYYYDDLDDFQPTPEQLLQALRTVEASELALRVSGGADITKAAHMIVWADHNKVSVIDDGFLVKRGKTADEWISEIPHPHQRRARHQMAQDNLYYPYTLNSVSKSHSECIECLFSWENTPQGFDYWDAISQRNYGRAEDLLAITPDPLHAMMAKEDSPMGDVFAEAQEGSIMDSMNKIKGLSDAILNEEE